MAFLEELKRRKVVRVIIAYAVVAFVVVQVADITLPALRAPDWVLSVIVVLAALGFPVVAVLAWAFDITPSGIERADVRAAPSATRRALLGLVALTVIVVAASAAYSWTRFASRSDLDANLLAVVPFRVTGDSDVSYLREGMLDLLAATLNGDAELRAADPRSVMTAWRTEVGNESDDLSPEAAAQVARRIGAGRLLLGSVIATGNELRISAELHHVDSSDDPVSVNVSGRADELHALIDRLAGQLLSAEAGVSENRLASVTTTSLPALRQYLAGQSLYRRSRFDEALVVFDEAVTIDSTFALALIGLQMSRGWGATDVSVNGPRMRRLIARHMDRLTVADAALARGLVGANYPQQRTAAEELADWETAIEVSRDRPEVWFAFADAMMHRGGLVRTDFYPVAVDAFEHTLTLDSTFMPAVTHLIDHAMFTRDTAAFHRYFGMLEADEAEVASYQYIGRRLFANGPAVLQRMDTLATENLLGLVHVFHFFGDVTRVQTRLAIDEARKRAITTAQKRTALEFAYFTLQNSGMIDEAGKVGEEIRQLAPNEADPLARTIEAALHWDGDTTAAKSAANRLPGMLQSVPPAQRTRATCALAQWSAARGQAHEQLLAALQTDVNDNTPAGVAAAVCVHLVRATHALRTQTGMSEAARALDGITADGPVAAGPPVLSAANLVLARLYEASGDRAAALRVVRREYLSPSMVSYLSTRLREEGRLAELNGERALAVEAYTKYLRLREPGTPGYDDVNRALQRLTAER
jgi:tetratricopeptide (TPR) repeat protein